MSDLNDSLKDSYIGKIADALGPYADDLKTKGFDPASRIQQLVAAGPLIENAIKARESAEAAASDAVKNEQGIRNQFYTLSSETVSLVEGLLGKSHALTVKLRGLRADLIGGHGSVGTPTGGATPPSK